MTVRRLGCGAEVTLVGSGAVSYHRGGFVTNLAETDTEDRQLTVPAQGSVQLIAGTCATAADWTAPKLKVGDEDEGLDFVDPYASVAS
ncbi:hypothetical protein [Streptomyces sp. NPDC093707]|uniref:hypothetical protein n=1 Tax=Streptomyces sp. NPDC093707 TaxID=3154984 RepID=UPI00344E2D7C